MARGTAAGARAVRGASGEGGGWRGVMTLPRSVGLGAELVALEGHSLRGAVALSGDGARLATGSDENGQAVDAATGEALLTFAGHSVVRRWR